MDIVVSAAFPANFPLPKKLQKGLLALETMTSKLLFH